eukprot:scaffold10600_cov107-Isochrysis_galbana.AAC.3
MAATLALLTLSLRLPQLGASAPNALERLKPRPMRAPPPRLVEAPQASKHEIFNSPNWPALFEQLNRLPTFTVANERGQPLQARGNTCPSAACSQDFPSDSFSHQCPPLQYESPAGDPLAIFYCDVEAAKKELVEALKM